MRSKKFDLVAIEISLREFQNQFPALNARLSIKRDPVTEELIKNILAAYAFVNNLLADDIDIFSPAGLYSLLEINHIVLCGVDPFLRQEYYNHIQESRKRFYEMIDPIRNWVLKKKDIDPYKLVAGFYTITLSQPQLFIEGNHRSSNIMINYILICNGRGPYIISPDTAIEYLEISTSIKFSNKGNTNNEFKNLKKGTKLIKDFLETHGDEKFTRGNEG